MGPTASESVAAEDRYEGMKVTKERKVFFIRLNRPKRKNAWTLQMFIDVGSALREAAEDKDVAVAVLTGTGDYYSSGNDLGNFGSFDPSQVDEQAKEGTENVRNMVNAFIDFPKPLIALVNGPAVGIAVTLLGHCDAVYCSDRATFHTPFTQLGQSPEACSSYIFPKLMGNSKAAEMLIFNKKITAQEAYERNLVTKVFPDAVFRKEAESLVFQYTSLPPQSMQYTKKLNRDTERELLHKVNRAECARLVERLLSEECRDAVMSFFSRKMAKL